MSPADAPIRAVLFDLDDNPRLDVWGPARVGLRTAWLDTGRAWPSDLARADWEVRSLPELCTIHGLGGTGQM